MSTKKSSPIKYRCKKHHPNGCENYMRIIASEDNKTHAYCSDCLHEFFRKHIKEMTVVENNDTERKDDV